MKKIIALQILFISFSTIAQDKLDFKFFTVKPEDFKISNLKVDTTLGGVIIADIGTSEFEGNSKGWFTLVYKHKRRVKIIDKKGFDLASVVIPIYVSSNGDDEEKLENIKAYTYNLENGIVVETKLDKDAIFKEKQDKNHYIKKFSMPAVKEGSIIEYSYTIKSDFLFNLQPWAFQGSYPRVWSEYELNLPNFFEYVFLFQGYNNFDIKTAKEHNEQYSVISSDGDNAYSASKSFTIPSTNTVSRWVIKNVPSLKEEKFTTSIQNHISKIEFQMSAQQFPNMPRRDIIGTWPKLTERLLKDEDFGEKLDKYNLWLNDDMRDIVNKDDSRLAKAKKIFSYVKENIKCIGNYNIYLTKPVKEILKTKSGYVADVNLLLITLLRKEDIKASPVILSTRRHGFPQEYYPLVSRFNYVICKVDIEDQTYFLDASKPYYGFNKLPQQCLNGHARVVDILATSLNLSADTIVEKKETTITLLNDEKQKGKLSGFLNSTLGYYESSDIRAQFLENGKTDFEKKIRGNNNEDFKVDSVKYENEKDYEKDLTISYNIEIDGNENNKIIYFNPMLKEGYKENIFAATTRKYPVEMPYLMDETYNLVLEIPAGYTIDEMPKSERVNLNDGDGMFEYIISKSDDFINLTTRIKLNKATFPPEDYESIRSFFDHIVKKHAEQIVFKKK